MRLTLVLSAIAALVVSTASAPALESSMSATSSLSADELWSKVGDFCAMPSWHPRVAQCDLSADGRTRTIRYFGINSVAVETLDNRDDAGRSYAFRTVSTPLPIVNQHTRVRVRAGSSVTSGASVLELVSSYVASGVSDADARRVIAGSMFRSLCIGGPLRCSSEQQPAPPSEPIWFDSTVASATPVTLQGYLRRRAGPGPFPAVVLMHGCGGGAEEVDWNWGVRIAAWGYVTLTIDRHAPRGLKNACGGWRSHTTFMPMCALTPIALWTSLCTSRTWTRNASSLSAFRKVACLPCHPSSAARKNGPPRTSFARRPPFIRSAVSFGGR